MSDFGMSKEGASSVRPPLLTDGYILPTITPTSGGEDVLKPKAQWNAQEFEAIKWNNKAMHAILCAMDKNQYKLIQTTKIAKEAWEILETAY
ncbi:hypothetical protein QYF36_021224 [Acer negundo]|nr:hypothetical protein QYF36_021224 [Acer negundo]